MTALAIMLQIPAERPGQPQRRQRRGKHQETECDIPLADLIFLQPAADQHLSAEADQPLHHGKHKQDYDALGQ